MRLRSLLYAFLVLSVVAIAASVLYLWTHGTLWSEVIVDGGFLCFIGFVLFLVNKLKRLDKPEQKFSLYGGFLALTSASFGMVVFTFIEIVKDVIHFGLEGAVIPLTVGGMLSFGEMLTAVPAFLGGIVLGVLLLEDKAKSALDLRSALLKAAVLGSFVGLCLCLSFLGFVNGRLSVELFFQRTLEVVVIAIIASCWTAWKLQCAQGLVLS
jgi:hypothetical protein